MEKPEQSDAPSTESSTRRIGLAALVGSVMMPLVVAIIGGWYKPSGMAEVGGGKWQVDKEFI